MLDNHSHRDWFYIPLDWEVATELLSVHGEEWEGSNKFDGFYSVLKEALETHNKHHAPHLFCPKSIQEIEQELRTLQEFEEREF